MPKYRFISLFSGCGGFDLGFIKAGYQCIGAYELNPAAVEVYRQNIGKHIQEFDLSNEITGINPIRNVDVVLAGPPCQGFSTAGKRDLNDPRNRLLLKAAEIAMQIKPRVFILENVRGVISGKHKQYWEEVIRIVSKGGYHINQLQISATDFGLPQMRKRLILVASRKEMNFQLEGITNTTKSLRHAFKNIRGLPNHNKKPLSANLAGISKHIKSGQKLSNVRKGPSSVHTWDIPEVFGKTSKREKELLQFLLVQRRRNRIRTTGDADPVHISKIKQEFKKDYLKLTKSLYEKNYIRKIEECVDLTNTFNGKCRRIEWGQPSFTVDTKFGDPRQFLHPKEDRGFTVREAARIQGFPDDFVFLGSEKDQFQMIGNAVPPPLAKGIAVSLKKLLKK